MTQINFNDDMVTIGSFYGVYSISQNKKYLLGWGTIGDKNGYVLLENNKFLLKKFNEKINVGSDFIVSDNGNFVFYIVNDLDKLKGTFYAMDKSGEVLINKKYNALINNIGLSPEGNFAVCSTHNSNSRKDSCTFSFFNLYSKTLLWQIDGGGADFYEINEVEKKIYLKSRRLTGKYAYDFSGNFIDSEKYEKDCQEHIINNSDGCYFIDKAKEEFNNLKGNLSAENTKNITELLNTAFKRGFHNSPYYTAWAHRIRGEIHESLNREIEAINDFETALKLYPKIGIKKRLKQLKEKNKDILETETKSNTALNNITLIENKPEIITNSLKETTGEIKILIKEPVIEIKQALSLKPQKKWYEFWK